MPNSSLNLKPTKNFSDVMLIKKFIKVISYLG